MAQGNPNCGRCQGSGRVWGWNGWTRCGCTRVTKRVQDMMRKANEGAQPYKSITQRIKETENND